MRYQADGWTIESGQYQRSTGRLPAWYLERPHEIRGEDFYITAFSRLGTTRQFTDGGGFGPIPWTAARDYACEFELSPPMRVFFCDVILALDGHYREHTRKKHQEEAERTRREQKAAAAGVKAAERGK